MSDTNSYLVFKNKDSEIIGYGVIESFNKEGSSQYLINDIGNNSCLGRNPNYINHAIYSGIKVSKKESLETLVNKAGVVTDLEDDSLNLSVYYGMDYRFSDLDINGGYIVCRVPFGTCYIENDEVNIVLKNDSGELTPTEGENYIFIAPSNDDITLGNELIATAPYLIFKDPKELEYNSYIANFQELSKFCPILIESGIVKNYVNKILSTSGNAKEIGVTPEVHLLGDIVNINGYNYQCLSSRTTSSDYDNSKDWIQL